MTDFKQWIVRSARHVAGFLLITNGFAAPGATVTVDAEQLSELIAETKALRKEVAQLRNQVNQKSPQKPQAHVVSHPKKPKTQPSKVKTVPKPVGQTVVKRKAGPKLFSQFDPPPVEPSLNPNNPETLGGGPIMIQPNTGIPAAYNGADLLTNIISWSNNNLIVLQYRESIERNFAQQNAKTPSYYAVLSGTVGGLGSYIEPYQGLSRSDIDLTIANLTTMAGIGKWVTGLLDLDYYNYAPASENPPQFGERVSNSRVYVDQGYLTVGNLDRSPLYATVGQMFVPFASFYGYGISSPLTASLFASKQRPLILGYSNSTGTMELDAEVYAYHGDMVQSADRSVINEWGTSADYLFRFANWSGDLGLGYISNIADAGSMQANGQQSTNCTLFNGYAFPCRSSNLLQHRVPGFDVHANLTFGSFNFISEYITATRPFAPTDMTFNNRGASPKALDVEVGYLFNILDKPSSIAMGYGFTKQALALLLPQSSYVWTFTTSIWPRTQQSFGYQRNYNYSKNSNASAQEFLPAFGPPFAESLGHASNQFLLSMLVSF